MKKVYEASWPGFGHASGDVIDLFSSRTISAFSRLLTLVCFAVLGHTAAVAQGCPGGSCSITCPPDVSLCLAPDNYGQTTLTANWLADQTSSPNPDCNVTKVWLDAQGTVPYETPIVVDCDDVGESRVLYVSREKYLWPECRSSVVPVRVHFKDCEPPSITCPPMGMYVCNEDIPRPGSNVSYDDEEDGQGHHHDMGPFMGFRKINPTQFADLGGSAFDACGIYYILYKDQIVSTDPVCKTNRTITRTFIALDVNGNTQSCTQTLVVADNEAPTFTDNPADLVITCDCGNGNGGGGGGGGHDDDDLPPRPPSCATLIQDWLNKNTNPGNQSGQDAVVTDRCNENMVMIVAVPGNPGLILDQMPEACDPNPREVIVVFTASDGCGNVATRSAKVILVDTEEPEVPPIQNSFYQCASQVPPLPNLGVVVDARDNCTPSGKLKIEFDREERTDNGCPSKFTLKRYYTITDCAGNVKERNHTIYVNDDEKPYWNPAPHALFMMDVCNPADLETQIQGWMNDNGGGTALDNCSTPTVTVSTPATDVASYLRRFCDSPGSNLRSTTVTFTARDECGNTRTATATVRLMDTRPPDGTPPPTATYDCAEDVPQMLTNQVIFLNDNCSDGNTVQVAIESNPTAEEGCEGYPFIIIRKWRLTDCAGNTSIVSQLIKVQDETPPQWTTFPDGIDIDCTNGSLNTILNDWLTNTGGGVALDQCSGSNLTYSADNFHNSVQKILDRLGPCAPKAGTTTVTFYAKDQCGNSVSRQVVVNIRDNTPPTATRVESAYSCEGQVPPPNPAVITDESDSCSPNPPSVVFLPGATTNNGGKACPNDPLVITRWYKLTDCSGNTSSQSHRITVMDMEAPNAECKHLDRNLGPNGTVMVTAAEFDNGSTDNCGIKKIEIRRGSSGPWFDKLTFDCSDIPDIPNCGANVQNSNTLTIQMRVTDNCDQTEICTTTITISDIEPPTIECPDDMTFYTDNNGGYDCKANATWDHPVPHDNCSVKCMTMEVQKEINGVFKTINPVTGAQSPNLEIDVLGQTSASYLFGKGPYCDDNEYKIIYRVRDEHGNNKPGVMCMFKITIKDNEAPQWNDCPVDPIVAQTVTGDCYQMKCWTRPTAFDNCEAPTGPCPAPTVTVSVSDPTVMINQVGAEDCALFPVGRTVVTYTAEDYEGNTSTCTVEVLISDPEPPVAMCAGPFTVNMEPDGEMQLSIADIDAPGTSDNCGICFKGISRNPACCFGPTVTLTCNDVGTTVTITMKVKDCSEPTPNEATCTAQVTVQDMQSPGSAYCPADIEVGTDPGKCSAVVTYQTPTFNDGCGSPHDGTLLSPVWAVSGATFPIGNTTVTYTYTSASGYTVYCTFVVTVVDDENPNIVCPENVTDLTCQQPLPAPLTKDAFTGGTLTDNCSVSALDFSDADDGFTACNNDPVHTVVRTYRAFDSAGNSSTCSQSFTYIEDTEAPVFTPASLDDVAGTCAADVPAVPTVTADDGTGCGGVIIDYESVIVALDNMGAPSCPNQFRVIRTWVASDVCGNTALLSQTITINDNVNPVLDSKPEDMNLQCVADVPAAPSIGATDNCGDVTVDFSETEDPGPVSCPNSVVIRRTWTATDACGNTDQHTQVITVNDTTNPVLSDNPADASYQCAADVPPAPVVTASDNCGVVNLDFSELTDPNECVNSFRLIRTWLATDLCGNTAVWTQTITVLDDTDPYFTDVPADANVSCAALVPAVVHPVAHDNCTVVNVDFAEYEVPGDCPNSYTVLRRWVATDLCGNQAIVTQTITVSDTEAPVFDQNPLPDAVVNVVCAQDVPVAATLTATDNCDGPVSVIYSEELRPGDCQDQFSIRRVWTAEDLCGNIVRYTQMVNVYDNVAPVWDQPAPENPVVDCSENVPAMPVQTATDNCGLAVTLDISETTVPGTCPNQYVVIRQWVAQDACGNATTRVQTITVSDTEAPTWNEPAPDSPVNVTCAEDVPDVPVQTASDNCGAPIDVNFNEVIDWGTCTNQFSVIRTWTAADDCGNITTRVQVINVSDTEAPTWNDPAPDSPVNVSCSEAVPAVPVQTATDNCGAPVDINFNEVIDWGTCANQFSVIRTWTAADDCGNITTRVQVINVSDTEAPVLAGTPAATVNVSCSEDVPAVADVTASDNCAAPIYFDFSEVEIPGTCPNQYSITRTWFAQDDCGNSTIFVQTINISDTEAPVLAGTPAATVNVSCSEDVPGLATVTATDNCDAPVDVEISEIEIPGTCPNQYSITRTWTAEDDCGNSTIFVQTINISDTEAPVLAGTPEAVVNVECSEDVPALATVTATDNCDAPVDVEISEIEIPGTCPNQYSITRTWTAEDDCGNSTIFVQTINISDTEAPVWTASLPGDMSLQCGEAVPPAAVLTASDNCGAPVDIEFNESYYPGAGPNDGNLIVRTWTAEDDCGNAIAYTQNIEVLDTEAPELQNLPDATVEVSCADDVPAVAAVTATDNCQGTVDVDFNEVEVPGICVNKFQVIRTWTAVDFAGNSTIFVQTITVNDTEAPELYAKPLRRHYDCIEDVEVAPYQFATDNCDVATVEFSETSNPGNCPSWVVIERRWVAYDLCGNSSTWEQIIDVRDTIAPVMVTTPVDRTYDCVEDVEAAPIQVATDNCGVVTIDFSEFTNPGPCVNQLVINRRWVASDLCGNTSEVWQQITVFDNEPPVFVTTPVDRTYDCIEDVEAAPVQIAEDNCGIVTYNFEETENPGTCANQTVIYRRWYAFDLCGNSSEHWQTITVNDTEIPVLHNLPDAVVNVECSEDVPAVAAVTATDNCEEPLDFDFTEVEVPGTCPNQYQILRTWTASDDCGNATSFVQTITISDTEAPTWTSDLPGDLSLQCGETVPPAAVLTATDNCNAPVDIEFNETYLPGAGPNDGNLIVRTWTAEDDCGNAIAYTQNIEILDIEAPSLENTPEATVNVVCAEDVPAVADVTATDNCQGTVDVDFNETILPGDCAHHFTLTRTWTATDFAGNSTIFVQTINVNDNVAPTWTGDLPADITVQCGEDVQPATLTATDNCSGVVQIEFNETLLPGAGPNDGATLTRTWTAYDVCGNSIQHVQVITILDTEAPTLNNTPDATVNVVCAEDVPAVANVTATDNCQGTVDIDFNETILPGDCAHHFTLTRTWTAIDFAGNSTIFVQTINVNDNVAPTWTGDLPADITVQCGEDVQPATLTATDNCSGVVQIEFNETLLPGSGPNDGPTLTRTWTAYDVCGNSIQHVQVISINDTQAPQLADTPADATVSCSEDVPAVAVVTATDNCQGTVDFDFTEVEVPGTCPNQYQVVRTWTATDFAGNTAVYTQTITVSDTEAPSWNANSAVVWINEIHYDNAGTDADEFIEVAGTAGTDLSAYSIVLYNGANGLQYGVMNLTGSIDNESNGFGAASFSYPVNGVQNGSPDGMALVLNGSMVLQFLSYEGAFMALDGPANGMMSTDIGVFENGTNGVDTSLSLTGTGNKYSDFVWNAPASATAGSVNNGQNFTAPAGFNLPVDITVQCGEDVPMPAVLTASDNCNAPVDVEYNETFLPGSGPNDAATLIRTWTAEDDCGNAIAYTQTISINDIEAPVLTGLPDATISVSCSADVPAAADVTVTDNCQGTVDLDFSETILLGTCVNQYTMVRTWTATDFAGNTAVFTQTISVNDTQAPVWDNDPPANATVTCADLVPAVVAQTATDNCGGPVIVDFSETVQPGSCLNKFTLTRTWTAQDACGNITSRQQVITVNDDVAPVLTCPEPLTAQCSPAEQPPYANLTEFEAAGGTASDNCGLNVNSFGLLSEVKNGNVYTRTYRVVDQCGNTATCQQTVTVLDTEPPVFLNCPVGPLVFGNDPDKCSAKINWPTPVAVDNCSIPTVVQTSGPTAGSIVAVGNYTVSFTATDAAGNMSICSFIVMVMDTQNPEFDADILMPGDVTVECDAVPAPFVLTTDDVHDNCTPSNQLTIMFTEVRTDGNCKFNYTLTRTWKVTDLAGNMLIHTQIVTVRDTKAPTALCKNITITLDKAGNASITGADVNNGSFDNCSAQADLTLSVTPSTFDCSKVGTNVVTLTVTDECGNSATCTATVTVLEGIGPCTPQFTVTTTCMDNATTLDNGQFMDLITVKSLAMQTWTLMTSTGLYSTSSPAPPTAPVALAAGTAFTSGTADGIDNDGDGQTDEADEMIYYTLKGIHVDGVGYSAMVKNNLNQTGTISNKAFYPTPYFVNLNDPFCLNTPPFVIEVGEYNNAQGNVINVMVDGVLTNIFDAAALGIGFHTVMATFDAGTATTNLVINGQLIGGTVAQALADPGCKQKITKIVQITDTPPVVVCNDLVNVSIHNDGGDCVFVIAPDDVLEGSYLCDDDYSVVITYPFGTHTFTPPNRVDYTHIGKLLKYSLVHAISGNVCWGNIKVEDKEAPKLTCPTNITIKCSDPTDPSFTGQIIISDCNVTVNSVLSDDFTDFGSCNSPRAEILRTWLVTDGAGNQASCSQVITISPFDLADVQFPADVTIACDGSGNTDPSVTGSPSINGSPIGTGGLCMASISKTDEYYDICPGSYEIIRTWKVRNMCLPVSADNPITHTQVVKVIDTKGPAIACPGDVTVSVDPFSCCATAALPDVIISETCSHVTDLTYKVVGTDFATGNLVIYEGSGYLSDFPGNNHWDPDTLGVFGFTQCLPRGEYTVTYTAADACGNVSKCTFTMTVEDGVPPVSACDEFTQVALGGDGMAFVNASTFDDGSYDVCNNVYFKARRMNDNDCQDNDYFYDQVKFCCDDINDTVLVVFRVYDVQVQPGAVNLDDYEGHYNDCMVQVFVEDKIKPICSAPANTTVSCENFDPSLWAYGFATGADNCCLDTVTVSTSYSLFDTVCNRGTITRTFRAFDCGGNSAQCSQRIFVNYEQDYWVKFPNDVIVTVCDGTGNYGEPTFNGVDCELLGVSHEDEIFTVVPDACYKIERTWTVINWCTYNPNGGCVDIPNPNPNATVNHPSNLTGPTISPLGTPAPWTPTNIAVAPGQSPTNYSVFYHGGTYNGTTVPNIANVNCYRYKQIIKVIDTQDPIVKNCPDSTVTVCDVTPNDANLWNESYWYDSKINSHNLCEGPTDLTITATDLCSGASVNVRYLLFLDLDGDGNMETVISSTNLPGFNNVNFGNAANPNFGGGTPRAFDERPVPSNQKYGFALQTTVSGTDKTAAVRWNTLQQPTNYTIPELPYGTHKIKWIVEDGCGNETVCEYTFVVKDCKAPTVVCINGLSVNIMPTKMIQMWANDFLQYTEDNCTPSGQIVIAIRRSGTGTGFPTNPDGTPQTSVTFTCDDLGTQLVELWAMDVAGNIDYCETYVIVQDNAGYCSNNFGVVAGALKTEADNGLEDANVELDGSSPALPPVNMFDFSDVTGLYEFAGVPYLGDYTVTPTKDNDPLNGVSTFDLVLINKHILGLEPLNSPYKMIGADANNSRSITTFDIVELRKLILGIYTDLPNNTSWRFIDAAYDFPNPLNPFQTIFPETKQIADMQANMMSQNFVAQKVGDVNGNAVTSSLTTTDDRTEGTLLFDVQDRTVKAGETFTVNFRAAERVLGYQFTMYFPNLEVVDVQAGPDMKLENFGIFNGDHALTTSFDNEHTVGEFSVTFRAKAGGALNQMLSVSSRITKAEAYNLNREQQAIALRFNGKNGSTIAGLGFELYQNQPNPWMNTTQIGFYLPEATEATLTIYDETGRTLLTKSGDFARGYNAIGIERALVNTTGVLYYKLETATDSAVKKMIQTK